MQWEEAKSCLTYQGLSRQRRFLAPLALALLKPSLDEVYETEPRGDSMKKYLYVLAALVITPQFVIAQSIESDVDAELDQMYSEAKAAPTAPAAPSAAIESSGNVSGQPIYILNQATPTSTAQVQQSQVQKQPTTVIEASPLTESRAEQMRRARQDSEVQTEQRIVEKLENSRLEDEKRRADALFGDKLNNSQNRPPQVEQVQPVIVAPVVQAPIQKVEEPKENTRDIVREELAAAMRVEEETKPTDVDSTYVGGILGVGDYPGTQQIQGNYTLGVSMGIKYTYVTVEGSFLYSNYTLTNQINNYSWVPGGVNIDQYTGSLAVKYQLFQGAVVRPVLGGLLAYSYRNYTWKNLYSPVYGAGYPTPYAGGGGCGTCGPGYGYGTSASTHAVDFGTILGADLVISPNYTIGLDFRYMWNMISRLNADNTWMVYTPGYTPVEKLQYYILSFSGRFTF